MGDDASLAPPPPPTIVALKKSFIAAQTRLLSQPLVPSRAWRRRDGHDANNDGSGKDRMRKQLPNRAVEEALARANSLLSQHEKRVHAPMATRHVAEQIDELYERFGQRAVLRTEREKMDRRDGLSFAENVDAGHGDALSKGCDLTNPLTLSTLPSAWPIASESQSHPLEARRYAEIAGQLSDLSRRRRELTLRIVRLSRLQTALAPFFGSSPSDDTRQAQEAEAKESRWRRVQNNLIVSNCELEGELEKMRALLARVGGRIAMLPSLLAPTPPSSSLPQQQKKVSSRSDVGPRGAHQQRQNGDGDDEHDIVDLEDFDDDEDDEDEGEESEEMMHAVYAWFDGAAAAADDNRGRDGQ